MSDNDYDQQIRNTSAEGHNGPGLRLVLAVIVAVIIAVFIGQNRERVPIKFLVFDFQSRTWTAIAIAILLGVLLDRLILAFWRSARKRKN